MQPRDELTCAGDRLVAAVHDAIEIEDDEPDSFGKVSHRPMIGAQRPGPDNP
jgi:hypothetical protein